MGEVGVSLGLLGGDGQHRRHSQSYPGRGGSPVQPEIEPRHEDDEDGRRVDLQQVVADRTI